VEKTRFDTIARLFATRGSRRLALSLLAGGALLQRDLAASLAKKDRQQRRRRQRRRRRKDNADTNPASCYPGASCLIGPGSDLEGCDFTGSTAFRQRDLRGSKLTNTNLTRVDALGADFQGADLGGACTVGANLFEAKLDGADLRDAIICNTLMPDGSINTSGCAQATACCPVCSGGNCAPQGTCTPLGNICVPIFGKDCCDPSECIQILYSSKVPIAACQKGPCSSTAQCATWFPNQDVVCEERGFLGCPFLEATCCRTKPCGDDKDCPHGGTCCSVLDLGTPRCCAPGQFCSAFGCL
jgi:hypothetical protein